ncbi:MAG: large-conductance mechanosensitive channel protein MscL [Ignavibacteriaceae bacterium]|nr:large-conductance mechanosensitive channel protein MscL [Ignavibacteriaceae bacterium]
MWQEFKKFAIKGNALDMAVGIIIGAAFGTIVSSLVGDIIMPPIGLILGNIDFKNLFIVIKHGPQPGEYPTIEAAQQLGAVTVNYGRFINNIVTFLIVSFSVFMLIKLLGSFKKEEEPVAPSTKECPFCTTKIPAKAIKCSSCTADLK